MDSAYDAEQIRAHSRELGHVPLIDINPRRDEALKEELESENKRRKAANYQTAEDQHYNERSTVERVNGRLKDEFGGRMVRVRGHAKVVCHEDAGGSLLVLVTLADRDLIRQWVEQRLSADTVAQLGACRICIDWLNATGDVASSQCR